LEFYDVVKTRRSVRAYNSNLPNEDVIEKILEVVRLAPSGSNRQPWRFIIVTDTKKREELVEACGGQDFIRQAPIILVACGYDIKYNRGGYMGDMSFLVDVSIAFTHLILAARHAGLELSGTIKSRRFLISLMSGRLLH
jgi:nitroreductase